MPRLITLATALVLLFSLELGSAWAETRVALVIGNSGYEHAPNLPNPKNDAGDIAALLERLGFDVTLATDQDYQGMRIALSEFADKAQGADIATVYYAGHGIEVEKQNFLIPVDARLTTDRKVRFEAIALDDVLGAVEGAKGLQVVILDACRENPFRSSMQLTGSSRSIGRGLARIEPEGSSVLVAYSAKEGQVAADGEGRNSPYTTALLKTLETPGVEINILFRRVRAAVMSDTNGAQQPFVYSSLGADPIYLVPPAPSTPVAMAPSPTLTSPTASVPASRDDAIARNYELAERVGTPEAWEAFLRSHGDEESFYVQLAKAALKKLTDATETGATGNEQSVPPQGANTTEPHVENVGQEVAATDALPNSQFEREPQGEAAEARGWLGVKIQPVTEQIAESLDMPIAQGARVVSVSPEGPAATGGIEPGDVIVEFDGEVIEDMVKLPPVVADTKIGKTVSVRFWRNGDFATAEVTIGRFDEDAAAARNQQQDVASLPGSALGDPSTQGAAASPGPTYVDRSAKVLPVGKWAQGIAFDGRYIWVAESGQRTIAAFDITADGAEVSRVKVGRLPVQMDSISDGRIFSLVHTDMLVWQQRPGKGKGGVFAKLGECPQTMAASDQAIWVVTLPDCSSGTSRAIRIDLASGRQSKTPDLGEWAEAIALGHGRAWIAHARDGAVSAIDTSSLAVERTYIGQASFWAITTNSAGVHAGGNIEGSDEGLIVIIDPSTNRVLHRHRVSSRVQAMTADDRNVVAVGEYGEVWILSADGSVLHSVISLGTGEFRATDVMIIPAKAHGGPSDLLVVSREQDQGENGSLLVLDDWRTISPTQVASASSAAAPRRYEAKYGDWQVVCDACSMEEFEGIGAICWLSSANITLIPKPVGILKWYFPRPGDEIEREGTLTISVDGRTISSIPPNKVVFGAMDDAFDVDLRDDNNILPAMVGGRNLIIAFSDINGQSASERIGLIGFTAAAKDLMAQLPNYPLEPHCR